jgi:hypothetical protein
MVPGRARVIRGILCVGLLLGISREGSAATPSPSAAWAVEWLHEKLAVKRDDLDRVKRGDVVVRMVEDPGFREIAVLAVAALPAVPPAWTADFEGVQRIRRSNPDLYAMGRLGVPPVEGELASVTLDAKILPQLRKCRPTKCTFNGSERDIERYQGIDWGTAEAPSTAAAVFRDVLRERLAAYQKDGDAALPVLANRSWTLTTADAPGLLLRRCPSLAQVAPALDLHFRSCPPVTECAQDLFYWTREKVWRREVTQLFHARFDDARTEGGRRRVLAEKLVYANHYFLGALTVTGVLEDASGTYVFLLNRSETDNRGPFNFIERALAGRLIRGRVERQMMRLRDGLGGTATIAPRSHEP